MADHHASWDGLYPPGAHPAPSRDRTSTIRLLEERIAELNRAYHERRIDEWVARTPRPEPCGPEEERRWLRHNQPRQRWHRARTELQGHLDAAVRGDPSVLAHLDAAATFPTWLLAQVDRPDEVGDAARLFQALWHSASMRTAVSELAVPFTFELPSGT